MQLVEVDPRRLQQARVVIAGYTGRDDKAVRDHIEELARLGVARPASIPEFYPIPSELLTFTTEVDVESEYTSGEVEPILIRLDGELYLSLGSDHTDRKVEAETTVAESKARCPKPVSALALHCAAGELEWAWDHLQLSCTVDGRAYQADRCSNLRPLTQTLDLLMDKMPHIEDDLVLFGGTVPLLTEKFEYGEQWEMTLQAESHRLDLNYNTRMRMPEGAASAKG